MGRGDDGGVFAADGVLRDMADCATGGLVKKTSIGIVITLLYLSVVIVWCVWRWPELAEADANKMGTFLSGVFSPIAFLWLVLGYFQQGEELRQNTKVLELQAEELKNSVRHQGDLVDVTRNQLLADISRVEEEQRRQTQAAKPKFRFSSGGGSSGGGRIEARIVGKNVGNTAVDVVLSFEPSVVGFSPTTVVSWSRGEEKNFVWTLSNDNVPDSVSMTVSFVDAAGTPGTARFTLSQAANSPMTWQALEDQ
jgi:hypothetical protein